MKRRGNILRGEAHPRAKLKNEDVLKIRELYAQGFSTNVIARTFHISQWNVKSIGKRETWTHI